MSNNKDPHRVHQKLDEICSSDALTAGGLGVRFEVVDKGNTLPAFVIRHAKGIAAYINRCTHLALELDWDQGLFFDVDQHHLICATHGALYTAETGECVHGPCNGSGLKELEVEETEGIVYLTDPRYIGSYREIKFRG